MSSESESEKIGEGTFGCIYKPPLKCKTNCRKKVCKFGISKLMTEYDAILELSIHEYIDPIDPKGEFHLLKPHICEVKYKRDDCDKRRDTLLIYEYGGVELQKRTYINKKSFVLGFKNLIKGVVVMSNNNIIHRDIKGDNILVSNQDHFRFIDLGIMLNVDYFFPKIEKQFRFIGPPAVHNPPLTVIYFEQEWQTLIESNNDQQFEKEFNLYLDKKWNKDYFNYTGVKSNFKFKDLDIVKGVSFQSREFQLYFLKKFDIYSLGFTLLSLLNHAIYTRLYDFELLRDLRELGKKMADPNLRTRITAEESYFGITMIENKYF